MMKKEKLIWFLVFVMSITSILDIFLTISGTSKFGIESEGNSLVTNYLHSGLYKWILLKGFGIFLLSYFTFLYLKTVQKTKYIKCKIYFDIFLIFVYLIASIIFTIINIEWIYAIIKY